jgi:hypothetical protein
MRWKMFALAGTVLAVCGAFGNARLAAAPINPQAFRLRYEEAKKTAEVVAEVRVLSAVCTDAEVKGKARTVTLQVSLQVVNAEKGPVKKNDVLVVSHKVTLPGGPGPLAYGYMAAVRRFPFTPGVEGAVALRWDNASRRYVEVAGWVAMPNGAAIPTEVGKVASAAAAKPK